MKKNRYTRIIENIFFKYYFVGATEIPFKRTDIEEASSELGIALPKNIGDVLYSFRYRAALPMSIVGAAPENMEWVIRPAGRGAYKFALAKLTVIEPSSILAQTKIPDATPGIISKYVLDDEQSLLAKIRHNRLVDIFTGLTCYSLQSHLRTTVAGMGQVETDELYVGLDQRGVHYVIPIQAKGRTDKIGTVQIEQDFAVCADKFPALICIPIAAQFMADNLIALFAFEMNENGLAVSVERHYRLAPPESLSLDELAQYRNRPKAWL